MITPQSSAAKDTYASNVLLNVWSPLGLGFGGDALVNKEGHYEQ